MQFFTSSSGYLPPIRRRALNASASLALAFMMLMIGSVALEAQVTISGVKWYDSNANGVREPGEPGIPGWTIILFPGCLKAVTDANGNYSFTILPAVGDVITVIEVQRPGWKQTFPCPKHVFVIEDLTLDIVANFGNFKPGFIKGEKFNDLNCNGVRDPGDFGLEGWVIKLSNGQTTITDEKGRYCFCVPPGTYEITEAPQKCWTQTFPDPTIIRTVTVDSCDTVANVDFGNALLPKIEGVKYYDANCNGVRDAGEPGLEGWSIVLLETCETVKTDEKGRYCFWVQPGNYTVSEALPSHWKQTSPKPTIPGNHRVNVAKGQNISGLDFGNCQPGEIKGMKFEDLNCNGVKDPGEPGLAGWTIKANDCYATITDANGNYCLTVPPGTYTVCEMQMPGWTQTAPDGLCHTVTVDACETVTDIDFGNAKLSKIEGFKFADINCDGEYDPANEPLLPGWVITLSDGQTTVTNADGTFCFFVKPGTYTVCEEQQAGWTQTCPPNNECYTVDVPYCDTISGLKFGNFKYSKIEGCKWWDRNFNCIIDPDEDKKVPCWYIIIQNPDGTYDTTKTDETGTYCFFVKPGTYRVCEIVKPNCWQKLPKEIWYTVTIGFCETISGLDFLNQCEIDPCEIPCDEPAPIGTNVENPTGPGNIRNLTTHPNPAAVNVEVAYSIQAEGDVKVEVYNLLGQRVMTVDNSYRAAGQHTLQLNVSAFETGTYHVMVQAANDIKSSTFVVE